MIVRVLSTVTRRAQRRRVVGQPLLGTPAVVDGVARLPLEPAGLVAYGTAPLARPVGEEVEGGSGRFRCQGTRCHGGRLVELPEKIKNIKRT